MLWLLWKVYQFWVVYHNIQMHSFLKVESLGETRCKKSWSRFEGYDSLSLRYVKQVFGKRKDHRWEKYKSKILISEVPTLWNLRTGPHEKTARQQRCARSKAWNLAKNIYKLKEKDKTTFYSPAEEWVLPAASTKELEEGEFVVDSGASMHMVSKKDIVSPRTFRRTQIAISASRRKKPRGFLQKTLVVQSFTERKISLTWQQQITKFWEQDVNLDNNHRYAVVVHDLATQWLQFYPCKKKTSQENQKSLMKFLDQRGNQKSFTLTIPWNLASLVEELSWNHCTSTPHRSETNRIGWKSSAQNERMDICGIVAIRSGWKRFKISCLMRRHHMKGGWEYHLMARLIRFGAMVEYHLFLPKTYRLHQFGPKSLTRNIPRLRIIRGVNLERRHFGRRHWRIGGDGRIRTPRQKALRKGIVNADERW